MEKSSLSAMLPTIPTWAEWIAQDEDGTWWAYKAHPNQQHHGWYESEVGRIQCLGQTAAPLDWQTTVRRVKTYAALLPRNFHSNNIKPNMAQPAAMVNVPLAPKPSQVSPAYKLPKAPPAPKEMLL